MVERSLSMREAVGSMPTFSIFHHSGKRKLSKLREQAKRLTNEAGHHSLVVERQPCKLKVMGSTPIDGFLFLLGSKTNLQPRL